MELSNNAGLSGLHIEGRRWFQRTYGNTYHSVRIYADGKQIAYLPSQYGYGDSYIHTALEWLKGKGFIPADVQGRTLYTRGDLYLRENLGGTYGVADVGRRKDL